VAACQYLEYPYNQRFHLRVEQLGTSTHDGLGIAFAVCEELIHNRSLVFFATHFQELTTTLTAYHNVVNLHLETEVF
jgi:DNA mismatch repair protein MSH4